VKLLLGTCDEAADVPAVTDHSIEPPAGGESSAAFWVADGAGFAAWGVAWRPPTALPLETVIVAVVHRTDGAFLACAPVARGLLGNSHELHGGAFSPRQAAVTSRSTVEEAASDAGLDGYSAGVLLGAAAALLCLVCGTCGAVGYCCLAHDPPPGLGSSPDKRSAASTGAAAGSEGLEGEAHAAPAELPLQVESAVDKALRELRLRRPLFLQRGLITDGDVVSASNADLLALGLSHTQVRLFRRKMDPLSSEEEL
jgi:hypothetical protein